MLCDETFYDRRLNRYTVKAFLEHGRRQFGGYDSVVLWHAYPRIGIDSRNQFDFYRDMPGGLEGMRGVVDQLHRAGVKAFIDYNPWDTGTRREEKSDIDALCEAIGSIGADGIFLDTMEKGAAEFRAKLDMIRPGVVLEGEGALPIERIVDHHASWAQHFDDSDAPGVLRNKWFERQHLQHQIRRWEHDHTSELHAAWMNGSGIMVWENVFGSWLPWSERDRSILRAMLPIQRRFYQIFCGEDWTPLVPTLMQDLYASLWTQTGPIRLWTLVNRADRESSGEFFRVSLAPGERLYDLIAGEEKNAATGRIAARGIGCFVAAPPSALGKDFFRFLKQQKNLAARATWTVANPRRETRLTEVNSTRKYTRLPSGMAEIRPAKLRLTIQMRNRECGFYESCPPEKHNFWNSYNFSVQSFHREVEIGRIAIDLTPVTNAQYEQFIKASAYRPSSDRNFLKHWVLGAPPPGQADHPVVYVSLDDARAYARWAGKRLPTEEEWQYGAQGQDGRSFPWGNEMSPECCNNGKSGGTTPVTQFPKGRSPFGLYDMCGNIWHWTESERTDGRTRFCIIRGGSYFEAKGSGWYMDGGPRLVNFAAKFLLMWPGLDRCATIGFRCVSDLTS